MHCVKNGLGLERRLPETRLARVRRVQQEPKPAMEPDSATST